MDSLASIPTELHELNFRHLQLVPDCVNSLEQAGILTVGHAANGNAATPRALEESTPDILDQCRRLMRNVSDQQVDWVSFWRDCGSDIYWLSSRFGMGSFSEQERSIPLEALRKEFGALLNIPIAEGVKNLGELIDLFETGILPWRGFGRAKILRLGEKLAQISGTPRLSQIYRDSNEHHEEKPELSEEFCALNISILGLGAAISKLRRHGFRTIGSLAEDPAKLWRLPGVGRKTVGLAQERIQILRKAWGESGPDLQMLARIQSVRVVPDSGEAVCCEPAAALTSLIREICEEDPSDHAAQIHTNRIARSGSDAATLEEVAAMFDPPVTRERVRQIEKRILVKVRELLMAPHPILGCVIVHPELRCRFQSLALELSDREQVAPAELAGIIAEQWQCTMGEAMKLLPLIIAIYEGTARTSADLRRLGNTPDHLFRSLPEPVRQWPTTNIGASRSLAKCLAENGVTTLDELRLEWLEGRDFGKQQDYVFRVLGATRPKLMAAGSPAATLGEATGRALVPSRDGTPAQYLGNLKSDIALIIREGKFWTDSERVFLDRICKLPDERPTLAALGERLGRLGNDLKRTETETLARLAHSIAGETGGHARCIFREDWLAMWQEMKGIYRQFAHDQRTFRRSLEQVYEVEETAMTMAMPTIWAVLSGLPTRKSYGSVKNNRRKATPIATVKLTGFRSVH
ncbi:helix-hairpin-helix domain-containing protein [Parerythrobacter jejuensis]|uniref:RNA polymerase sigma-70 region 4 domain-containing protein n=1 Tax=Parerythrobacter jejuensis TaxID=795812 RepID=A0A845AME8_9SPHN|nr:helix-hairpin-helix domain-containing protein [Parerythrobacter jejuensis]MXP30649.1 hypothetical protein [Parerythrobacter jejuensis]MXP33409.1 hypothetical protein [Parerythrobacter jejuensis]